MNKKTVVYKKLTEEDKLWLKELKKEKVTWLRAQKRNRLKLDNT